MQRRKFVEMVAVCALALTAALPARAEAERPILVAASFDAMAELVKAVGGSLVRVETLIPPGAEPHDFTPTVKTTQLLRAASVLVVNGFGMEPWAKKIAAAAENPRLMLVTASEGAVPVKNSDPDEIAEHGADDPHLWLSLSGAEIEARNIAEALAKADPKNAEAYRMQFTLFKGKLHVLKTQYSARFRNVKRRFFVTGHAAFAYLCRDFNLEQKSVEGVFAEGEPTPKRLAELAIELKKAGVRTVFAEKLLSPAVSKTLAQEAGARVETIYTMESAEDGKNYLERMRSNLEKIESALDE